MLIIIRPYNLIDRVDLKELKVDRIPVIGDPVEIDSDMYIICDIHELGNDCRQTVGVIPLVNKTNKELNKENYLESLNVALRKMQERSIIFNQY